MRARWFLVIMIFLLSCAREEQDTVKILEKKTLESKIEKKKIVEVEKEKEIDVTMIDSNPFLTFEEQEIVKSPSYREPLALNLSAVFYSPPTSKVVINGRIFKEGDIVDNKRIIEIKPEKVVLKDTKNEYLLKLKGLLENNNEN